MSIPYHLSPLQPSRRIDFRDETSDEKEEQDDMLARPRSLDITLCQLVLKNHYEEKNCRFDR
ncbi:hypothetical protein ANCCAN_15517 [Ancylostoma caninum]|uniref:Uncharacterized protein n=1 Tax=Ancylostoma caninum TaxID=29170 RepID=A0A368G7D1_ANCCA|nr:hypothetical protein ANCCAN_15517 [Ancylostoma caninum]